MEGAPELPDSPDPSHANASGSGMESVAVDDTYAAPDSNGRAPPSHQVSNISLPIKKSGLIGTSSNLVNSIVGAGIIGSPYASKFALESCALRAVSVCSISLTSFYL
jgi:hypothetical protein